jgi:hypothetical protein
MMKELLLLLLFPNPKCKSRLSGGWCLLFVLIRQGLRGVRADLRSFAARGRLFFFAAKLYAHIQLAVLRCFLWERTCTALEGASSPCRRRGRRRMKSGRWHSGSLLRPVRRSSLTQRSSARARPGQRFLPLPSSHSGLNNCPPREDDNMLHCRRARQPLPSLPASQARSRASRRSSKPTTRAARDWPSGCESCRRRRKASCSSRLECR